MISIPVTGEAEQMDTSSQSDARESGLRAHRRAREGVSLVTKERSVAAKIYFENYFDRMLSAPHTGRAKRRMQLEEKLQSMDIPDAEKRAIRQEWLGTESEHMRRLREKISVDSFDVLSTIGNGAFGVVKLVREKATSELFAMKVMRKVDMLRRGQEGHVRAERDLLSKASESATWIVKLVYSFQDSDNLYLVMEYMAGGDLLSLLIKRDVFEEDFAKFYAAEMVTCIEEAHRLG
ncbi:MAG: kinase-like domain-containing protein [Olpidium bornovanus]|uniref:non-specific serine/threonine protein kinase n=1 Tax=Olpidium bornovanus TaxID=278681 RepID=A0A8H7ZQI6_9FUNG|nr:MAG: kinase-like domain-containing protein [Olpidium bornovanus]